MAKTKALISFAVTAKLICVFVFVYAKSRFSHDAAHFIYFQASKDEINQAYKRLSKVYHPDKHQDPLHKKNAENLFSKLKKAHESKYSTIV